MTIRVATLEDLKTLEKMAFKFISVSPYAEMSDTNVIKDFILTLLKTPANQAIILIGDGGMIGGITMPFLYGTGKMATEVAWWVDEDKRNTGLGKELIEAFEYWAEKAGCKFITMVSLDEDLGKYYEKRGYTLHERSYLKVIN